MRAVLRVAGLGLRARWRDWLVLTLLIGLAGGAVLAASAGARRTASAYPRFLRYSHASDLLVATSGGVGGYDQALGRLPGVAASAPLVVLNALPVTRSGRLEQDQVVAPLDGRYATVLDRPKLLAGRPPRPGRPGEAMVDQLAAARLGLHVGSPLVLALFAGDDPRPARRLTERVTGIMVTRGSVVPVTDSDRSSLIVTSAALFRALGPSYEGADGATVKLRPGASPARVTTAAQALTRRYPATQGQAAVADESAQAAAVQRSIRPQAVALALFALCLAITALVVTGQLVNRLIRNAAVGVRALAAMGMTRPQLQAAALVQVVTAATVGAVLACGTAVAASPLMPIGPARLAEPAPGVSVDGVVLGVGTVGIVLLMLAWTAWPAWRASTAWRTAPGGPVGPASPLRAGPLARPAASARLASWLARAGAPVTVVTGMRLVSGRATGSARGAVAGAALAVVAVTAAATFGASLIHLVSTPRLYGQDWDAALDLQFSTITPAQFRALTAHVPGIAAWTFGDHGTVQIGRTEVPAIGLTPGHGPLVSPPLLDGHTPRSGAQIVLGTSVLRQAGLRVGQTVTVTVGGDQRPRIERITGQAVFPYFGEGGLTPTDLGQGALVTSSLLARQATAFAGHGYSIVLVRFTPGPGLAAARRDFERAVASFCAGIQQSTCLVTDQRPNGVTNYVSIDRTPQILAGLLAVLGLAVLAQFAAVSARQSRHDFAVLAALGLQRRQLRAIRCWQLTALSGLVLLIGLPLGIAAGRYGWGRFAAGAGVPASPVIPVSLLLLTVAAVLAAATVMALRIGGRGTYARPDQALRAE